jgi:RNA polymerase sigma factor (TIGR02999 family)
MLHEWGEGNEQALEELIPLIYDELRRQANFYLAKERQDHTLQATALINEIYLKLVENKKIHFQDRTHFFAVVAKMMRRFLVDYARSKNREKRGGKAETLPFDEAENIAYREQDVDLIALDEALERLEKLDERQASVVELHYFGGLTLHEVAEVLKVSYSTVKDDWAMAKAWLFRELTK